MEPGQGTGEMSEVVYHIFVVSDGTGATAEMVVRAALVQFEPARAVIHRLPYVRTEAQVKEAIEEAAQQKGIVVHTLVSEGLRKAMLLEGRKKDVATIDIMGPLLLRLTDFFQVSSLARPGIFRGMNEEYYRRIDAIEFAVKHDDGQNLHDLQRADLVLVGVSRTSKTPLSIYLAGRTLRVANIPIVLGIEPPAQLFQVEEGKVVGLSLCPERLMEIRKARLRHFPIPSIPSYAELEYIKAELEESLRLFRRNAWPIVDVTSKSLEEVATEILEIVKRG